MDEDIRVPVGFRRNAEAYREGYRRVRDALALKYPGPDRVAHQAGWVQRQRDEANGRGTK